VSISISLTRTNSGAQCSFSYLAGRLLLVSRQCTDTVYTRRCPSVNCGSPCRSSSEAKNSKIEYIYRVSQEEWTKLRESVPYVELYRYNPKYLYPKLNGYGDNGHRKVWASGVSTYCTPSVTPYSYTAHARQPDTAS